MDESWVNVTDSCSIKGDGMKIAQEISNRMKFEMGITVSIGVSWNKIFAKLGSDYKKPNAITQISREKQHKMDVAVDEIRRRFGFYSVQRGLMYRDRTLAAVNAKEDNVVHPHGYMERGNRTGAYAG